MASTALTALIAGGAIVTTMGFYLLSTTLFQIARIRRKQIDAFEIDIRGEHYSIDLNALETEDTAKIDQAIRAVQQVSKIAA